MIERYEGVQPAMTEWWYDHLKDRPLVVIKCAHGDPHCGKPIGEVKRDGQQTMALCRMVRPEPTVPRPQLGAPNAAELQDRIAEREQHVLKRFETDEGQMEVMKQRRDLPAAVGPLELFSSYSCPKHGPVQVDKADLADFVADSDDTLSATRTYWAPRAQ